jgi:UDP-glucose-4-epimerase GalE
VKAVQLPRADPTTAVQNVLVTGGAGYIGSHACKALSQAGFQPVTFDNLSSGHQSAVRWGPFVRGDLADTTLIARVLTEHRIAAVIHFAAFAYVGESMSAPGKYFRNNVANTVGLLNAVQSVGVPHLVFSSSCATYGVPQHSPIDESHPQRPVNPYGESKLIVEQMLRWIAHTDALRYVALRYFNAAGADPDGELGEQHDPETHLLPLVIDAAQGKRDPVKIFGTDYDTPDGTAVRDYIHVTDLARAHVLAVRHLLNGGASAAVNLGTGTGHSVRDVVRMVEQVGQRPVPVDEHARRAGDPPALVAGSSRARDLLNWTPQFSDLQTIVSTAWAWHARHDAPAHTSGAHA